MSFGPPLLRRTPPVRHARRVFLFRRPAAAPAQGHRLRHLRPTSTPPPANSPPPPSSPSPPSKTSPPPPSSSTTACRHRRHRRRQASPSPPSASPPQNAVRFTLAAAHPQGHLHHLDLHLRRLPRRRDQPRRRHQARPVADPISILLYPGRWFPMSRPASSPIASPPRCTSASPLTSAWSAPDSGTPTSPPATKPSTPSTGPSPAFPAPSSPASSSPPPPVENFQVYTLDTHKSGALEFGHNAAKQFEFMTTTFGQPESGR